MKIFDNLQHDRRRILERLRDESLTVRLQRRDVCADNEIVGKPSRRSPAATVDDECWIIFRHNIKNLLTSTTFDILLLRPE